MSTPLPQLQNLLLDLFSTRRAVTDESVMALAAKDWETVLDLCRQHRLGPMLHWRLTRERRDLPIPESVRATLAASFKAAAMRSLVWQRELLLTHRILKKAGIPHVALKGAYLAPHAYPNPALRPLRDLDILVPGEMAIAAYQTLIEGGLSRIKAYPGMPEASLGIDRHLPPLRSPSGQTSVELHPRLFDPENTMLNASDPGEDADYWQRVMTRPLADDAIAYASPTDLLLHLIVHAVYEHAFTNGPLFLSDLAYLLETQTIDWPLFWRLADEKGVMRGCVLSLHMLERYFGPYAIDLPEAARMEPEILAEACLLSLRSLDARTGVKLESEMRVENSLLGGARVLLGKIFLPRRKIASAYPVSEHSPLVYLWYPVKWWRYVTLRLPEYLRSRQAADTPNELRQLSGLSAWLRKNPG